jgi:hypothetical protein
MTMKNDQKSNNSMLNSRTEYGLAVAIRIEKGNKPGISFMVVEGISDCKFYGNMIDDDRCEIKIAEGKTKALKCLKELDRGKTGGVIAIIDLDFDFNLPEEEIKSPNLFFTDTHDIETMIIKSKALEKVVREHKGVFESEEDREWVGNIRQRLTECTFHLGLAMKTNKERQLRLTFKSLPYQRFVDERYTKSDIWKLTECLFEAKGKSILELISIEEFIDNLKESEDKMKDKHWLVCRGHDMTSVLALIISENTGKNINKDRIESDLRLAYEYEFFKQTDLYSSIIQWETNSPGYKVFR